MSFLDYPTCTPDHVGAVVAKAICVLDHDSPTERARILGRALLIAATGTVPVIGKPYRPELGDEAAVRIGRAVEWLEQS